MLVRRLAAAPRSFEQRVGDLLAVEQLGGVVNAPPHLVTVVLDELKTNQDALSRVPSVAQLVRAVLRLKRDIGKSEASDLIELFVRTHSAPSAYPKDAAGVLLAASDLLTQIRPDTFLDTIDRMLDRSQDGGYIPPHVSAKVLYAGAKQQSPVLLPLLGDVTRLF